MYSSICDHPRLKRVSNDFVRCLKCGQSIISQKQLATNKSSLDFATENSNVIKNFDRNFSNVIEETDAESTRPQNEYYIDRTRSNYVIVNKQNVLRSQPAKFEVSVNNSKSYLTDNQIRQLLNDISAIRTDKSVFYRK